MAKAISSTESPCSSAMNPIGFQSPHGEQGDMQLLADPLHLWKLIGVPSEIDAEASVHHETNGSTVGPKGSRRPEWLASVASTITFPIPVYSPGVISST